MSKYYHFYFISTSTNLKNEFWESFIFDYVVCGHFVLPIFDRERGLLI
jgi:hypothetical protein